MILKFLMEVFGSIHQISRVRRRVSGSDTSVNPILPVYWKGVVLLLFPPRTRLGNYVEELSCGYRVNDNTELV